jgi:hypothetical protein
MTCLCTSCQLYFYHISVFIRKQSSLNYTFELKLRTWIVLPIKSFLSIMMCFNTFYSVLYNNKKWLIRYVKITIHQSNFCQVHFSLILEKFHFTNTKNNWFFLILYSTEMKPSRYSLEKKQRLQSMILKSLISTDVYLQNFLFRLSKWRRYIFLGTA